MIESYETPLIPLFRLHFLNQSHIKATMLVIQSLICGLCLITKRLFILHLMLYLIMYVIYTTIIENFLKRYSNLLLNFRMSISYSTTHLVQPYH